ncbi:hypothetical protein F1D05_36585 [Kribbella qitaiheensis]|uniref:Uncharacterized protein n=1 Tax=Kribbella qitaiheensis TaxID=1544730 RepID=A0A7G6X846_9ACTN|nr:hypothetical protein [Kribbella qitaiheensis]QNE22411.1 hypothetical protein F1D05_36585 [Kribbella qitaiheensis]
MTRWIRHTFALLFAVLITLAGATIPASAGGPTSVLLSAPPRVVAFGYEDTLYNQLLKFVGEPLPAKGDAESHQAGQFVRATWLIHDMSVWRLDIIYPDAPGGPWIATTVSTDGSGRLSDTPVWHRADEPAALAKLLGSLNLMGQSDGGPTGIPDMSQPTPTPQQAPVVQTVESDAGALSGWRWMIPGIALGAVATFLVLRYLPRRRPWELTDIE